MITGLKDDNGTWIEDDAGMGKVVEGYFEQIFTSSNLSGFDHILSGIQSIGEVDLIEQLEGDFQACEVKEGLNQMAPLTAPGPDGMSPIFYKSLWNIIGEDVSTVALRALNSGIVPDSINTTFITLIPKIKNPRKVSDFRPISLCNVFYKLIAKVVANRLKKFLANAVPDSQSAFLLGRLISDNILVDFETLHYLKRKTQGKMVYMALKLDMSKAYDRMEWDFLEVLMQHLGLGEKMRKLIMSCLRSVSYSILLNGQLWAVSSPLGGCARVICYHHTCFSCVQWGYKA